MVLGRYKRASTMCRNGVISFPVHCGDDGRPRGLKHDAVDLSGWDWVDVSVVLWRLLFLAGVCFMRAFRRHKEMRHILWIMESRFAERYSISNLSVCPID